MRSKDSQPGAHDEADDLEALASELGSSAPEADEVEDDVDLDRLAAVVAGRAGAGGNGAESEAAASEKLDLSAKPVTERPASAAVSPAPAAHPPPPKSTEPAPRTSNRVVPALVVLALGVGALGYALGRNAQPSSAPVVAAPTSSETPAAPTVSVAAPPAQAAPPVLPPSAPELAAAPPTEPPAAEPSTPPAVPRAGAEPRPKPGPARASASPAPSEPAPSQPAAETAPVVRVEPSAEKAEEPPVAAKSSVDDLLDQALSPGARRAEVAATPELPEAPSREEVTQTMAVLLPAIRGCAMGQTGLATAGIVVRADGRVASVELSGAPFAETASGRCMEGVIRRARFSRFRQPTFRVRFPFAIQ